MLHMHSTVRSCGTAVSSSVATAGLQSGCARKRNSTAPAAAASAAAPHRIERAAQPLPCGHTSHRRRTTTTPSTAAAAAASYTAPPSGQSTNDTLLQRLSALASLSELKQLLDDHPAELVHGELGTMSLLAAAQMQPEGSGVEEEGGEEEEGKAYTTDEQLAADVQLVRV